MINRTWRRTLQDVRVRRGDNGDSDNHLVTLTKNSHQILKNKKPPGQDSLNVEVVTADSQMNVEVITADSQIAAELLQPPFEAIWDEEQLPNDWMEVIIMKILKKGTLDNCDNWRGIIFVSVPNKILTKIVITQISEPKDQKLRKKQT